MAITQTWLVITDNERKDTLSSLWSSCFKVPHVHSQTKCLKTKTKGKQYKDQRKLKSLEVLNFP